MNGEMEMNPNTWSVSNLGEVNLIQLGMLYKLLRNDRENLAVKHRNVLQNHVNISYPDREEEIQVRLRVKDACFPHQKQTDVEVLDVS